MRNQSWLLVQDKKWVVVSLIKVTLCCCWLLNRSYVGTQTITDIWGCCGHSWFTHVCVRECGGAYDVLLQDCCVGGWEGIITVYPVLYWSLGILWKILVGCCQWASGPSKKPLSIKSLPVLCWSLLPWWNVFPVHLPEPNLTLTLTTGWWGSKHSPMGGKTLIKNWPSLCACRSGCTSVCSWTVSYVV